MYTLLRKYAEWKARRKAAQIIIFDGGAEVERTRSFLHGALAGVVFSFGVFALTAPTSADPQVIEEARKREALLKDTNERMRQALQVADMCVNTAEKMEKTLSSYQDFLGSTGK